MTQDTHNKYFKDINYNTDASVDWTDPKLSSGHPLLYSTSSTVYEARIISLISQCKHVRRVEELIESEVNTTITNSPTIIIIIIIIISLSLLLRIRCYVYGLM